MMSKLQSNIKKDKIVYIDGVEHTITECGHKEKIGDEYFHCVLRLNHKGPHKYSVGTGYR
jgi:hypothetical protein